MAFPTVTAALAQRLRAGMSCSQPSGIDQSGEEQGDLVGGHAFWFRNRRLMASPMDDAAVAIDTGARSAHHDFVITLGCVRNQGVTHHRCKIVTVPAALGAGCQQRDLRRRIDMRIVAFGARGILCLAAPKLWTLPSGPVADGADLRLAGRGSNQIVLVEVVTGHAGEILRRVFAVGPIGVGRLRVAGQAGVVLLSNRGGPTRSKAGTGLKLGRALAVIVAVSVATATVITRGGGSRIRGVPMSALQHHRDRFAELWIVAVLTTQDFVLRDGRGAATQQQTGDQPRATNTDWT